MPSRVSSEVATLWSKLKLSPRRQLLGQSFRQSSYWLKARPARVKADSTLPPHFQWAPARCRSTGPLLAKSLRGARALAALEWFFVDVDEEFCMKTWTWKMTLVVAMIGFSAMAEQPAGSHSGDPVPGPVGKPSTVAPPTSNPADNKPGRIPNFEDTCRTTRPGEPSAFEAVQRLLR